MKHRKMGHSQDRLADTRLRRCDAAIWTVGDKKPEFSCSTYHVVSCDKMDGGLWLVGLA